MFLAAVVLLSCVVSVTAQTPADNQTNASTPVSAPVPSPIAENTTVPNATTPAPAPVASNATTPVPTPVASNATTPAPAPVASNATTPVPAPVANNATTPAPVASNATTPAPAPVASNATTPAPAPVAGNQTAPAPVDGNQTAPGAPASGNGTNSTTPVSSPATNNGTNATTPVASPPVASPVASNETNGTVNETVPVPAPAAPVGNQTNATAPAPGSNASEPVAVPVGNQTNATAPAPASDNTTNTTCVVLANVTLSRKLGMRNGFPFFVYPDTVLVYPAPAGNANWSVMGNPNVTHGPSLLVAAGSGTWQNVTVARDNMCPTFAPVGVSIYSAKRPEWWYVSAGGVPGLTCARAGANATGSCATGAEQGLSSFNLSVVADAFSTDGGANEYAPVFRVRGSAQAMWNVIGPFSSAMSVVVTAPVLPEVARSGNSTACTNGTGGACVVIELGMAARTPYGVVGFPSDNVTITAEVSRPAFAALATALENRLTAAGNGSGAVVAASELLALAAGNSSKDAMELAEKAIEALEELDPAVVVPPAEASRLMAMTLAAVRDVPDLLDRRHLGLDALAAMERLTRGLQAHSRGPVETEADLATLSGILCELRPQTFPAVSAMLQQLQEQTAASVKALAEALAPTSASGVISLQIPACVPTPVSNVTTPATATPAAPVAAPVANGNASAPVANGTAPIVNGTAPVSNGTDNSTAPVANGTAPVTNGTAPVANGTDNSTAPVSNGTAPVANGTAPVANATDNGTAPVANSTAPVANDTAAAPAPVANATAPAPAPVARFSVAARAMVARTSRRATTTATSLTKLTVLNVAAPTLARLAQLVNEAAVGVTLNVSALNSVAYSGSAVYFSGVFMPADISSQSAGEVAPGVTPLTTSPTMSLTIRDDKGAVLPITGGIIVGTTMWGDTATGLCAIVPDAAALKTANCGGAPPVMITAVKANGECDVPVLYNNSATYVMKVPAGTQAATGSCASAFVPPGSVMPPAPSPQATPAPVPVAAPVPTPPVAPVSDDDDDNSVALGVGLGVGLGGGILLIIVIIIIVYCCCCKKQPSIETSTPRKDEPATAQAPAPQAKDPEAPQAA